MFIDVYEDRIEILYLVFCRKKKQRVPTAK